MSLGHVLPITQYKMYKYKIKYQICTEKFMTRVRFWKKIFEPVSETFRFQQGGSYIQIV